MEYWQSYKSIVLMILGIINLEEKRDLRNIVLVEEILSTHCGSERNTKWKIKLI